MWPQAPQLFVSLEVSVHIPPQQAVPFMQSPLLPQVHWPLTQVSPAAQAWAQDPQLLVVVRSVQAPPQQPWPELQPWPQAPQLLVVASEVHAPLQQPWPAAQQTPLQQLCPLEQQATAPPVAMQAAPPEFLQALQAVTQALYAALRLAGDLAV
jgi:hypothetical protein